MDTKHQSHDAGHTLKRWAAVARAARLEMHTLYVQEGLPVVMLRSSILTPAAVYFSAGVHGDEAGAVAGLLAWAEADPVLLRKTPVMIVPLFNPWGLLHNSRLDHTHTDLNRCFHDDGHPHIKAWRDAVLPNRFRMAICLHEDYDAQGVYCYELHRNAGSRLAQGLLDHVSPVIPRDPRRSIDGRPADRGVIQRRRIPVLPGEPEAITLYQKCTDSSLTFETPSEFSLSTRTQAHAAFISAALAM